MDDTLISIYEVAKMMGVSKRSVQFYIEHGDLKAVLVNRGRGKGSGRSLFHCTKKDIEEFHAKRAARKRIEENAKRFGEGLNQPEL